MYYVLNIYLETNFNLNYSMIILKINQLSSLPNISIVNVK